MSSNSELKNGISVCIKTPKLGSLIFFIIFLLAIPAFLINTGGVALLKYYLPFTVMLASTLTTSGYPDDNQDLYPQRPVNLMGFLSKHLIEFVALIGILWQTVDVAQMSHDLQTGVITGLIMMIITFPIATQAIPFFIRSGDIFLHEHTDLRYPGNWHRYFLGFFMIIALIGIEMVLIDLLTEEL